MNFRRPRTDEAGINLTPLIDVVFLLLIFFMVSTTFERHADIQLQLPEAEREPVATERAWVDILVDATGHYYVDGRELVNRSPETLERAVEQALTDRPDDPVLIRADAGTTHQSVVTALDVVGRLGVTAVSIATIGTENDAE